jgi:hypothetical protein
VSSAKRTGVEIAFTTYGRSLIYITNNKGPRTEPCGIPCLIISHSEYAVFSFLQVLTL